MYVHYLQKCWTILILDKKKIKPYKIFKGLNYFLYYTVLEELQGHKFSLWSEI